MFLVVVLVQTQTQVEAAEQAALVDAFAQRGDVGLVNRRMIDLERGLQPFQQNLAHGQAAVMRIDAFDHMPGRVVPAGLPQHPLTKTHETVVGFRLLPVQRADPPAVQRVVLERLEPGFHLLL
ncbi:hypothetical protein D3C78_1354600 [compost metagenome]